MTFRYDRDRRRTRRRTAGLEGKRSRQSGGVRRLLMENLERRDLLSAWHPAIGLSSMEQSAVFRYSFEHAPEVVAVESGYSVEMTDEILWLAPGERITVAPSSVLQLPAPPDERDWGLMLELAD